MADPVIDLRGEKRRMRARRLGLFFAHDLAMLFVATLCAAIALAAAQAGPSAYLTAYFSGSNPGSNT